MNIRVKANGGLGNKMRVLASCIALHKSLGETINVIWENSSALNCSYSKLFKPIDGIKIHEQGFLKWYNRLGFNSRQKELSLLIQDVDIQIGDSEIRQLKHLKSDFLKLIKDFHSVYVSTCEAFYGDESYLAYLLPIDSIQAKVEKRKMSINGPYVGIHIRRGDNMESTRISTTNKFNKAISDALDGNKECQFFLSTDNKDEAEQLIKNFGSCIHHFPSGLNRSKEEDIQSALVDLLTLSGAESIIGSYWSSFSEVASGYSGIPLLQVGADSQI